MRDIKSTNVCLYAECFAVRSIARPAFVMLELSWEQSSDNAPSRSYGFSLPLGEGWLLIASTAYSMVAPLISWLSSWA